MLKAKQKTVSILLACLTMLAALVFGFVSFFKTPTTTASAATTTVTDELNRATTGVTNTSYASWSGKTVTSSAVYAGQSAGGNGSIQLRSDKNNSGIVTTTSGGKAKKITVVWNSNTASGRTLNVYGKNTAYTQATDLYNSTNRGTLLGTIVKGTSEELTISGDYTYIGLRSASKAMYLTSISIEWEVELADGECSHDNETWEITKAATCTEAGEKTFTCPDCDNVRTETIDATGHNTTETITTEATCTTAGEKAIACKNCEYTATEVIPALGHTYVGGACSVCGAKEPTEQILTLTFDDKAKRTEYSTTKQVWTENGVTLTNTGSVGDYSNPVRLYANSKIVIECANMVKIEFTCSSNDYATALKNSIDDTATVSGSVVTVEFSKTNEYTIASLSAQVRMNSLTVYTNACAHDNTTTTTVDATCTVAGSITVTCDDCGATISTDTIAATGHNMDAGVTTVEPQIGVEGEITYTCQNGCGYTETESIPALNATKYTLTYSVPNGVEAPEDVEIAKSETTVLPSIDAPEGFTFLGWASEEYTETKTTPTYLKAASEYTLEVEENVTLYALFTYSVGSGDFVKVTENRDDWSGEYLIVYETGNVAFDSSLQTLDEVSNTVSVEIENNTIGYSDILNNATFAVSLVSGSNYSIQAKNGQYIGRSANSNGLDAGNTAVSNTLSIDDSGNAVITAAGGTILRFNKASNQNRFRYYKSGQEAIALYALDGATYYATDLSVKIDSASVTVGDSLTVNYKVSMPAVYADAMMQFTLDGKDTEVKGTLVGTQYVFSLPVPPQAMADNIEAKLYFGETIIASKATYSIQEYAQNRLNDSDDSTEKRLVSDMLYYGAAAQNYKEYKLGNLATTGVETTILPAEDTAPTEASKSTNVYNTEITEYPAYIISAGVYFDSVNQLYIKLNTIENVKVYVKIGDGEKTEANLTTGTTYYTDGISARGFATEYVFEVYHDGTLMQTLTYSVNAYAYAKQNDAKIGDLALALYRYGVSAAAYNA